MVKKGKRGVSIKKTGGILRWGKCTDHDCGGGEVPQEGVGSMEEVQEGVVQDHDVTELVLQGGERPLYQGIYGDPAGKGEGA